MKQIRDEYTDYFAEFYDVLHRGTPEIPLLERLADTYGKRVLEFGCGTGRLLLPMAERGMNVVGIDSSPDMLAVCRKKLSRLKKTARKRVDLLEGNMNRVNVGREFDLVVLACNTFLHATTTEAQGKLLRSARRRLRPGGALVLDIRTPTLEEMAGSNDRWETFVFHDPERNWMVIDRFRARYDLRRQVEQDEIRLTCVRDGKVMGRFETRMRLAVAFPREVFHAVAHAGFAVQAAYSDHGRAPWKPAKTNADLVLVLTPEE